MVEGQVKLRSTFTPDALWGHALASITEVILAASGGRGAISNTY